MSRQMKNSGTEWMGTIPESWGKDKIVRLFNVIGSGTTPKSSDESNYRGNINWIQSGDINGGILNGCKNQISENTVAAYSALHIYTPPFLIIAMYGASIGNISISTISGACNQACCVLQETDANMTYVFYALKAAKEGLIRFADGGGQPNISQDKVKSLWIAVPPLEEQARIGEFLDKQCAYIDSVIEKTKASIEEYKKLKQAIITRAVTKGVRGNRDMRKSGIERVDFIPTDWKSLKMKYFMYIRARLGWKGLTADEYVDDGYTFIGTPNIDENGNIDWENVYYITQERYDESPEIKLAVGDVLLTKDGAGIGKCAYIESMPNEAAPNGSLAVITCNELMHGKFLFYYFKSYYFQKYIDQIKDGMGVPHLFQGDLKEIAIPVPDRSEQDEIISYLDKKCSLLDKIIEKKSKVLLGFEEYKKSLIYEYVTGKKEVPQ